MNDTTFNQKKTIKYLIWTFLLAWVVQVAVAIIRPYIPTAVYQVILALMMFTPLLGVVLSGNTLRGMGWKPRLKGNIKRLLAAWFLPAFFAAIGAVLYFLVFPGHFDMSGEYLVSAAGAEALEQLETQGLTYPLYLLVSVVSSLTYATLINTIFAVGEEAGWRGFLYPQLKSKFGKKQGLLIGGIIWGIWHWPLIWLIGYEYGKDYAGFPIVGMLIFCIFTTTLGIVSDWLYEKGKSIWYPSIFHGAINAVAALPLAMCIVKTGSAILLGPAIIGVLAGLPQLIFAGILFFKADKQA